MPPDATDRHADSRTGRESCEVPGIAVIDLAEGMPDGAPQPGRSHLRDRLAGIRLIPPTEIADELERQGYKGQESQRAGLALMAYRHIRRLKRLHVEGEPRSSLPPKQNILMLGPTGCGKTYLVEMLFDRMFRMPTVVLDSTTLTERGYVGDDATMVLTRLIDAAGGDVALAECGVVCLDEFDKLAGSSSNARFAGQGTTKDVSGFGVQRELLAMIDGAEVSVPFAGGGPMACEHALMSTRDIPFVASGAFSGLDAILSEPGRKIGYVRGDPVGAGTAAPDVAAFQKYGFIPELIGRFSRTLCFPPLPADVLERILRANLLPRFLAEFHSENLRLEVSDSAVRAVVRRALARGTGARGLHAEVVQVIEDTAYRSFMVHRGATVSVIEADGRLECRLAS